MKLVSFTIPGSNKLPENGGVLELYPDYNFDGLGDNFFSLWNAALWSQTDNGNVTINTDPLEIEFGVPVGTFQLESTTTYNNEDVVCFKSGFSFKQDSAIPSPIELFTFYIDADIIVNISFRIADAGSQILYSADDSNGNIYSGSVSWTGTHSDLKVHLFSNKIAVYYTEQNEEKLLFTGNWSPVNSTTYTTYLYTSGSGSCGSIVFDDFVVAPLIEGIENANTTFLPKYRSTSGGRYYYEVVPTVPGTFTAIVNELSIQSGTQEIEYLKTKRNTGEHRFMASQVEKFYQENGLITLCPTRGVSSGNKSSTKVFNRCFDDGSVQDTSLISIEGCKYGRFSTTTNRNSLPQFSVNDYGCNFDFVRAHQDSTFKLSDTSKTIHVLRSHVLSDGKIVYYGIFGDKNVDMNLSFNVVYDWSADQDASPGLEIDKFWWEIVEEDGGILFQSVNGSGNPITVLNYLDAGNIPPVNQTFSPGRYAFKVYSDDERTTDQGDNDPAKQGAKIRGNVYQGATTADPLMNTGLAEAHDLPWINAGTTIEEDGECWIRFEVGQRRGKLVAFIVDPSSGAVTRHESALDASLKTSSLSLVELDDKIVIFHESGDNDVWHQDRKRYASFVELDLISGFGSAHKWFLPETGYLHGFDIVRDEDELMLFVSYSDDNDYRYLDSKKRSNSFTPIGPNGVHVYKTPLSLYKFDADEHMTGYNFTVLNATDFNTFFWPMCDRVGHSFPFDDQTRIKWFMPDSVRVTFSKELGVYVLSCVDMISRWPVVWMGNDLSFEEVSIPFHFSAWKWKPVISAANSHANIKLDSFSAILNYDGMLYSIATKGDLVEMGLIDPYPYFANIGNIAKPNLITGDIELYETPFKYEAYPLLSFDNDEVSDNKLIADINSHLHYMTISIGSGEYCYSPVVYKNSYYDKLPFENTCDNMWIPELQNNTQAYLAQGHVFNDEYVRLQDQNLTASDVIGTLDTNTCYRYRYNKVTTGYRFHVRMQISQALTNQVVFEVDASKKVPLWHYKARMLFDGIDVQCEVYDAGVWTNVGTISSVGTDIYDCYIFIQDLGVNSHKGRAAFVVKRFDDVNSNVFKMDFQQGLEEIIVYTGFLGEATLLEETTFRVGFDANGAGDLAEYVDVYQLDYGLIKKDTGMYLETPESGEILYTDESLYGNRFRLFNEEIIFDHKDGKLDYCFIANKTKGTTQEFHWNNGFRYKFSGNVVYENDTWTLQRIASNDPNNILSKNIDGRWVSENDLTDVYIYADAEDSGLDKFYVDMLVLMYSNFRTCDIVYKDNPGDAWTVLQAVNMEKYTIIHDSIALNGSRISIDKDGMSFFIDELTNRRAFYYQDGDHLALIDRNKDNHLSCLAPTGTTPLLNDTVGTIVESRKLITLDTPVEHRFIGIRIPVQDTYDGYFILDSLDFGKSIELPVEHSFGNNGEEQIEYEFTVAFLEKTQPVRLREDAKKIDISLNVNVADQESFLKILSLVENSNLKRRPFWFSKDVEDEYGPFYLVYVNGSPDFNLLTDEDHSEYSIVVTLTSAGVGQ